MLDEVGEGAADAGGKFEAVTAAWGSDCDIWKARDGVDDKIVIDGGGVKAGDFFDNFAGGVWQIGLKIFAETAADFGIGSAIKIGWIDDRAVVMEGEFDARRFDHREAVSEEWLSVMNPNREAVFAE